MNQLLTIMTVAGSLQIISLEALLDKIRLNVVHGQHITYNSSRPQQHDFHNISFDGSDPDIIETKVQVKKLDLYTKKITMDVRSIHQQDVIKERLKEELEIMIAKKKPDIYIKNLTIDELQNAINHCLRNTGKEDLVIVKADLGPWQRFVLVIDINDITYYHSDSQIMKIQHYPNETHTISFCGTLVDAGDGKFTMIRYDEDKTIEEYNDHILDSMRYSMN